jgi:hypothetical protein
MPNLLAGTIEFVHIEQISALFKFRLIQVSLYNNYQRVAYNVKQSYNPQVSVIEIAESLA